jgi:IS5 family transposase
MIEVITEDYEEKPLFNLLKIEDFISPTHPIIVLSKEIDWRRIEVTLSSLYSDIGRKAVSIKRLSCLLILKYIYNYSDASFVENWSQNLYYQAFTGEDCFNKELPCDPSTLTHFRKRIGVKGAELIFSQSVRIHNGKVLEDSCFIDTTVQPKNITFPTDSKLILDAI